MPAILYVTVDELRTALRGANASDTGTAAELSDDQLLGAIRDGCSLVSSYVGAQYVPTSGNPGQQVPELVHSLAMDLSVYYATLIYRRGKDLSAMDPVYLRYQTAALTLQDVVRGKIEVDPQPAGQAPSQAGHVVNTVPGVFTPMNAGVRVRSGRVRPGDRVDGYGPQDWETDVYGW